MLFAKSSNIQLANSRSDEGISGCENSNKNNEYEGCSLMNLST